MIRRISDPPARALHSLYGFGQKLANERASRLPPGTEARDIAHNAIAGGLEGKIAPPVSEQKPRDASAASANDDAFASAASPGELAADLAEDEVLALRNLCKRMANDARGASRTHTRRNGKSDILPRKETSKPEDLASARIDLLAALEKLSEMQRRAFVEIEIKGRTIDEFANENMIRRETAKTHLKRARRRLRVFLEDYDPNARDDQRGDS